MCGVLVASRKSTLCHAISAFPVRVSGARSRTEILTWAPPPPVNTDDPGRLPRQDGREAAQAAPSSAAFARRGEAHGSHRQGCSWGVTSSRCTALLRTARSTLLIRRPLRRLCSDFSVPAMNQRSISSVHSLDEVVPSVRTGYGLPASLRFIAVHMIEEYARHCGHADLLRETIDGAAGD
jgi:hypothetical protein